MPDLDSPSPENAEYKMGCSPVNRARVSSNDLCKTRNNILARKKVTALWTKAAERDAHIAVLRNVLRWECAWKVSEWMYYVHVAIALLAVMLRDLSMVLYAQETQILDPSNTC
ncbi:hypothetical protein Ddc_19652 [Ditylenchus destructor]|nr:hypothetical protein Ddc_19652 [Ditylenchus destructor]